MEEASFNILPLYMYMELSVEVKGETFTKFGKRVHGM